MKQQAALHIPAGHPAFAGHFPGMPIVPGVVLLDEAIQAVAADTGHRGGWNIASVKFLHPLGPDARVVIRYESQDSGAIRFDIVQGEQTIVTGSLTPRKDA
jgi:3-hydroxyacyl-[acyl-carrier-protein] dehydratase